MTPVPTSGRAGHRPVLCGVIAVGLLLPIGGCDEQAADAPADRQSQSESPRHTARESSRPALAPGARALLQRLEHMRLSHQLNPAIDLAEDYLARNPDTPRLHYAIGVLHREKDDHDAAIRAFRREIERDPGHFESHLGLASSSNQLGRIEDTLVALTTALAMRPGHAESLSQRGQALAATGRLKEAESDLREVADTRGLADDWSQLGLVRRQRGNLDGAVSAFETALQRQPRHPASLLNLGQLLIRTGQTDRGAALLEHHRQRSRIEDRLDQARRSARLEGASPANFVALADAQVTASYPDQAEQSYRHALAMDANYPPAAIGLASLLLERGELGEATRWSVVGVIAAPENFHAHYVLGRVRLARGDYSGAERAFEDSRSRGQWGSDAHVEVLEAYLEAGEIRRAEIQLERITRNDPEDERLPDLRQRMAQARAGESDQVAE